MPLVLWLMALLSSILFNLPFFYSDTLGFLILFFWIPIFFVLNKDNKNFSWSIILSIFIFIPNLFWIFILLLTKSDIHFSMTIIIYLSLILYLSVITSIFMKTISFVMHLFRFFFIRIIIFFCGLFSYFYFLINYSLILLGRVEGYPFINPLITLSRYKSFIFIVRFLNSFLYKEKMPVEGFSNNKDFKVFYLAPINAESENQEISPSYYGQKIYQRLDNLRLFAYQKKYSSLIIVAPESSFPFLINKYLDQVDLWSNLLPKNAILMIGTLRSKNRNVYQTVAFIKRGLIIKYYDKHHLVLFTEELNHFLKNFPWTKKLFLNGKKQLNCAKKDMRNKTFSLNSKWCIIPQICSEFFWTFNFKDIEAFQREHRGRLGILFLFSNDSWFVPYFRENIENLIRLKSIYYNLPVLYIAHNSYFLISNFERN